MGLADFLTDDKFGSHCPFVKMQLLGYCSAILTRIASANDTGCEAYLANNSVIDLTSALKLKWN